MTAHVIASNANRVVLGLGATGLSCARYLHRAGEAFSVVDTRANPPGLAQMREEMPAVPLFLGEVPAAVLETASELIVSPGIALDDPLVTLAQDAGVDVVGDVDLFVREATAPVIGITGSNAKSTVTELLGQMALDGGLNVGVGGNLGTPALDLLDDGRDLYVLELSSFQLERAGLLGLEVATVLNISADHLDRHGSMPHYHRAKHRIFGGCRQAVINRDDSLTRPLVSDEVKTLTWSMAEPDLNGFGLRITGGKETIFHGFESLLAVTELGLVGRHNIANSLAALALGYSAGLPMASMLQTLRQFQGLPHRCYQVGEQQGVRYIDDSKGTNPGATLAALEGLGGDRNIILIAGGQAKGADFKLLREAVTRHCKRLLLIGEAAPQLDAELGDCVVTSSIESSLEQAVNVAAREAQAGDLVLLSPACASFDMFSGYVQRGEVFAAAVATAAVATLPGDAS